MANAEAELVPLSLTPSTRIGDESTGALSLDEAPVWASAYRDVLLQSAAAQRFVLRLEAVAGHCHTLWWRFRLCLWFLCRRSVCVALMGLLVVCTWLQSQGWFPSVLPLHPVCNWASLDMHGYAWFDAACDTNSSHTPGPRGEVEPAQEDVTVLELSALLHRATAQPVAPGDARRLAQQHSAEKWRLLGIAADAEAAARHMQAALAYQDVLELEPDLRQ